MDRVNVGLLGPAIGGLLVAQLLLGLGAQRALSRQGSSVDSFGNAGERHTEIERIAGSPTARALLLGLVQNSVDQGSAGLLVALVQHSRRDLNQIRTEVASLPLLEDLGDRGGVEPVDGLE